jgi:uncharacterized protein (TIGR02677 family)
MASAPDTTAGEATDRAVDLWQLAGLAGGLRLASYLTAGAGTAAQYRAIVDVLLEQQQHTLTGIPHDTLLTLLADRVEQTTDAATSSRLLPDLPLTDRMRQLVDWGVVNAWDERPTREEDFLRNSSRYQLTPMAAEFHRAVLTLGHSAASSVAATFAPAVLRAQLSDMVTALGTDASAVAAAWSVVETTLTSMSSAAGNWQSGLAGALSGTPDAAKVAALQETLTRYVEMWGAGVDSHSEYLARDAAQLLDPTHAGAWRQVALAALGAEAADEQLEDVLGQYTSTLRRVLAWFGGRDSQARRLRRQIRDTIAPMIRGQRTLAAVGGHVSRRAELLALAGALERSSTDDRAWQLWASATGLFSARHLALPSPQPAGPAGAVSFWDADPCLVEQRLRRQGTRSLVGRPSRVPDRSKGKVAARARAASDRAATAGTRAAILARSGRRLSEWTELDAAQLDVLLMMLAAVAAAGGAVTGRRETLTGDQVWKLTAEPAPPGAPSAVLHTPHGRLVHPDIRLSFTALADAVTLAGLVAAAANASAPAADEGEQRSARSDRVAS